MSTTRGRGRPPKPKSGAEDQNHFLSQQSSMISSNPRKRPIDNPTTGKPILRRKIHSDGQMVLLAEAVPWSLSTNPRNLWTRIRKEPRFVRVLGQYNGNDMKTMYTMLTDQHVKMNMKLFGRHIVPRPLQYESIPNGNGPLYTPDVPPTVSHEATPSADGAVPVNMRTTTAFADTAKSTAAWSRHHLPLESHPLCQSAGLMPPPFGSEFGSYDSDDDADPPPGPDQQAMRTHMVAMRASRAAEQALREKVDSVGFMTGVAEVIAGYVAALEQSRVGVSELASRQLVQTYEADAAARVLLVQQASGAELPPQPRTQPTHIPEAPQQGQMPLTGRTLALELPPPVTAPGQPTVPLPLVAAPTARPDVTVAAAATDMLAPTTALPVWRERQIILHDAFVYYSNRHQLINLGDQLHPPADMERATTANILVDSCYQLRSLKTYLQSRCGLPLWAVLATCRLVVYSHSHAMRRAVLNHVIYAFFKEDAFSRQFFDMNIRGGGKHYSLAPLSAITDEDKQVIEALRQ